MKKTLTLLVALMASVAMQAQSPFDRAVNNEDEVVHIERWQQRAARPQQLIVKLQDYSDYTIVVPGKAPQPTKGAPQRSACDAIQQVLTKYRVQSVEQLCPTFQMPQRPRVSGSYGGGEVRDHDLSQLYLITLAAPAGGQPDSACNEYLLMEQLAALSEVEYAEPNYLCYALGKANDGLGMPNDGRFVADATAVANTSFTTQHSSLKSGSTSPNDPMYSLQWGLSACHIDSLLTAPKKDTSWRPIIAIIDTGVDVDHPDLHDNIWTNTAEAEGAEGQDDDNNGFKDDVHGWDFVNQTGDMHDFNSHGTHCAGIAGAVTNNGIGIAGACPDALIMPICVMQSDGTGDIATIVKGINYAAQNGADVISMSLGTYAYSIAMEQALAVAYQSAVLVAAAGNDARAMTECCPTCADLFPAAFTFVLGVQATILNGGLASFSNYDCTGPSFSSYSEEKLYNYELSAPGVDIVSTVPNGNYKKYNGTSMATPLVAGGIASLLQRRDYPTKELLFGYLINYSEEFHPVNLWAAYKADSISPAILQCVNIEVNDTAYGDSSMYADAGERVQLYPTLRTVWGPADSIYIWLEFQEYEDTTTIEMLSDKVAFVWPLSSYAHSKSLNPIDIRVSPNVVDGRRIRLTLCAATTDAPDTLRHDFTLTVTNGVKLHGMIQGNYTLYPDVQYIVTQNVAMVAGDTLFIKPGTTVKIKDGCSINATIMAIGKPDSMITFTKTDLGDSWNSITSVDGNMDYCIFEYPNGKLKGNSSGVYSYYETLIIRNSIFRYKKRDYDGCFSGVKMATCNIFYNPVNIYGLSSGLRDANYCNIVDNIGEGVYRSAVVVSGSNTSNINVNNFKNNNIFENGGNLAFITSDVSVYTLDTNYYGSIVEKNIRKGVYDFETLGTTSFGYLDLSQRAMRPSQLTHGIVWKVLVNGFDPQDEADSVEYLGVGTHKFEVYFNRAMDTNITPVLAMGVRPPYTQTPINKNSSWSSDSTIYTAYLTLTGRDAIDGVNRIYVSGAQDNEHFEIPYENQRFEVQVASSGSMSLGFQATPGIGKVDLEWNDQEVNYADFLGFNLYRYQYDSVLTNGRWESGGYVYDTVYRPVDTILLNSTLVQDTMYTDYDVVPGERYYYYYKILSTSLTENSPSRTVSCVPHSTIPGDANGSYAVDVVDVIATINYVTGQNPQPFLFDAADVNGDGIINVLDIVGIINLILHPDAQSSTMSIQSEATAIYTVENDTLWVDSPVALSGLQFAIEGTMADITVLEALNGFEVVSAQNDGSLTLICYSMSGAIVPAGKTPLLKLGGKQLESIVLSDQQGHNVVPLNGNSEGIADLGAVQAQFATAYPNPFSEKVTLELTVGPYREATILFTDLMGHTVDQRTIATPTAGSYRVEWNAKAYTRGIYFATLYVDGMKAQTIKLVVK